MLDLGISSSDRSYLVAGNPCKYIAGHETQLETILSPSGEAVETFDMKRKLSRGHVMQLRLRHL